MEAVIWNPWHGCVKYSEGCRHCYVYRRDNSIGKDASAVQKTSSFDLPIRKGRDGGYKIPAGTHVFACMTSDFFLDRADEWRAETWEMIRRRADLRFTIITKRIVRFYEQLPADWGKGYPHVTICCTMENQKECDARFPFFNTLPIAHKNVACEPLLSDVDMRPYLNPTIELVIAGGESGAGARVCDYRWVLHLREQCADADVRFWFKQTGAVFLKDGHTYHVPRREQSRQARKAGINL